MSPAIAVSKLHKRFPNRILFVAPAVYSGLTQRHQALAVGLSRQGFQVDYIDPIKAPGFDLSLRDISPTLRVFSLSVPFRFSRSPSLQRISNRFALTILAKNRFLDASHTLLWIADPATASFSRLKWSFQVYDRCDRHGCFPGQNPRVWASYEKAIYDESDLIFASSPALFTDIRRSRRANCFLIPNAVNASWISSTRDDKPEFPPLKIVSSGAHYEWIDFDWLEQLCRDPRVEMNVAGTGRGKRFKHFTANRNVKFHGFLSSEPLMKLLDACHVGIVPFKAELLTSAVDPIKVYEYAARGLAIWGTDVAGLREHPFVDRAASRPGELIDSAFNGSWRGMRVRTRRESIPTWDDRVEDIMHAFAEIA